MRSSALCRGCCSVNKTSLPDQPVGELWFSYSKGALPYRALALITPAAGVRERLGNLTQADCFVVPSVCTDCTLYRRYIPNRDTCCLRLRAEAHAHVSCLPKERWEQRWIALASCCCMKATSQAFACEAEAQSSYPVRNFELCLASTFFSTGLCTEKSCLHTVSRGSNTFLHARGQGAVAR